MLSPFTIPDALSEAECLRLLAEVAEAPAADAGLAGGVTSHDLRRADLVWTDDLPGSGWVMERILALVAEANRRHFDFALSDFAESPQVARYGAERQGHFDWHSDIGGAGHAARRKLTLVIQLSPPEAYAGGRLEIMPEAHVTAAAPERGTATLFPSFALHRVTPVTAGERHSLTTWAHGPAFR